MISELEESRQEEVALLFSNHSTLCHLCNHLQRWNSCAKGGAACQLAEIPILCLSRKTLVSLQDSTTHLEHADRLLSARTRLKHPVGG